MVEISVPEEKKEKKPEKILLIILIAITLIAAIFLVYFNFLSENNPNFTTDFSIISSKDAYDLINNSTGNLVIIDMRGCKCNYNKNHLEGAIWDTHPESFYNETEDILVYDGDGSSSIDFCKKLVNKVYGKIMFLQGGIDSWIASGYPIIE